MPRLIVNADDLGYDPEIDRGILEAHARGIVTSATAMVDTPFAAAALAAAPSTLGVGLHVVLGAGLPPPELGAEVRRQVERFVALAGRRPTHLDSHKHAHARPDLVDEFARAAAALGLPARAIDAQMRGVLRARGVRTPDEFLGEASLRPCWTPDRLAGALAVLPDGTSELMAHPGFRPAVARTSFGVEREVELAALCAPAVRRAIADGAIELISFAAL
jgi:predicted glycoside hydrolase/deacetylase ChbG (UPF0249 family)